MADRGLTEDQRLGVALSALIARHKYARDASATVEELLSVAGARADLLAEEAGLWVGFYETDPDVQPMVAALREIPGAEQWVELGRLRRSTSKIAR